VQLYLVHCGYYDTEICGGVYEGHVNFFVAAQSLEDARSKAKGLPEFKAKRMHVDGLLEVVAVDGYRVKLEESAEYLGLTQIVNHLHRDLAPKLLSS
jgi:hypothetical protein